MEGGVETEEPAKLTERGAGDAGPCVNGTQKGLCFKERTVSNAAGSPNTARIGKRPLDFVLWLLAVTLPRAVSLECGGGRLKSKQGVRNEDTSLAMFRCGIERWGGG